MHTAAGRHALDIAPPAHGDPAKGPGTLPPSRRTSRQPTDQGPRTNVAGDAAKRSPQSHVAESTNRGPPPDTESRPPIVLFVPLRVFVTLSPSRFHTTGALPKRS